MRAPFSLYILFLATEFVPVKHHSCVFACVFACVCVCAHEQLLALAVSPLSSVNPPLQQCPGGLHYVRKTSLQKRGTETFLHNISRQSRKLWQLQLPCPPGKPEHEHTCMPGPPRAAGRTGGFFGSEHDENANKSCMSAASTLTSSNAFL